jgi:hypothetical protein
VMALPSSSRDYHHCRRHGYGGITERQPALLLPCLSWV